jgi:exodeoxyribonuclease VII small subunit
MENITYEQALTELQRIVEALENGNISIDELAAQTERATELIRFCQEKLRQTEDRIQGLFD